MGVKRELKYFVLWVFWGPFGALVQFLPFSVICGLAQVIGRVVYMMHWEGRKRVIHELSRLFPSMSVQQVRHIGKRTFQNWCLSELENMLHAKWSSAGKYREFRIRGRERLDAAQGRGHGVILLIAHFGSHLQVLPALGCNGYTVNQVTNRRPIDSLLQPDMPSPGFFETCYYRTQELRHGRALPANMIITGGFMRSLFERLARNEIVIMAVDGRAEGRLERYPFLGYKEYLFSSGPIRLALSTGAAVLPSFTVRESNMLNILVIEEEIILDSERPFADEARDKTATFVDLLEQYVRSYPDHCGLEFFSTRKRTP